LQWELAAPLIRGVRLPVGAAWRELGGSCGHLRLMSIVRVGVEVVRLK